MELLSVKQAATLLGVDESRVRQLLQAGLLEGRRVGGRWLVDGDSTRQRKERGRVAGRPLSVRNAWGLLAALSGQRASDLSDAEWSRIVRRLRDMAAHDQFPTARWGELVRARAERRRYRVHSGLLPTLLTDPDVVRGGLSARYPATGYVAPGRAEIYVHPDRVGKLEAGFGLARNNERGNLLMHVPPAEAWSFLRPESDKSAAGGDAPAAVVAADLLDLQEDRAETAAGELLLQLMSENLLRRREHE
jgi:excisionase family DNA binding protein